MTATQLLVSVRNAAEAEAALRGGADIIDAKEPRNGALGPVDIGELDAITQAVGGSKSISAACGELLDLDRGELGNIAFNESSIRYRKFGLVGAADHDWQSQAKSLVTHINQTGPSKTIVVAYADHERCGAPHLQEVLDWALSETLAGLLIDTGVKDGSSLFDWLAEPVITRAISSLHEQGQLIALAGSLHGDTIHRAIRLRPSIVGVRGAACSFVDRNASIDESRVVELSQVIEAHNALQLTTANRDAG